MELYRRSRSHFWYVDIFVNGRRIRHSLKTSDKYLARIKAKELELRLLRGNLPAKHLPMQEFIMRWTAAMQGRVRPKTITARRNALDNLLQFKQFSNIYSITPVHAQEFVSWLLKKPIHINKKTGKSGKMKPVSVNTNIRNLRQVWSYAVNIGYAVENVWKRVPLLQYQQPEVRVLNRGEIKKMISSARKLYPTHADLFRFYLLTGMRLSEALELQWTNVDMHEKIITLTKTKGKYNRMIMILPATMKLLKARKHLPSPFPYDTRWIKRIYKRIVKHSQIKYTTIQDLRATTYSYLVGVGVPQALIRKIIGHTSDRIGQIHYFNMDVKEVLKHTRKLNKIAV